MQIVYLPLIFLICKSSIFPLSLSMFISHIYPLNYSYYGVVNPSSSASISSSSASSCSPPTVNSAPSTAAITSIHILRYSDEFSHNACPVLRIATFSPISYPIPDRQALLSEIYQVDRTNILCSQSRRQYIFFPICVSWGMALTSDR